MRLRRLLFAASVVAVTLTCGGGGGGSVEPPVETQPTNVLLILADDLGVDMFSPYDVHPSPAPTPNLDALAAEGMLFEYFYSLPSCSPTRAAVLTGRMPFRYGIGKPIDQWLAEHALPLEDGRSPKRSRMAQRPASPLPPSASGTLAPSPSVARATPTCRASTGSKARSET